MIAQLHFRSTALVGVLMLTIAVLSNQTFSDAIVKAIEQPTPETIVSLLSALCGALALYIAKPIGVADQKETQ